MRKDIVHLIIDEVLQSEGFIKRESLLDQEESEHEARKFLDEIESYINKHKQFDCYVTLQLYPNIPVVKKFMEKWKVEALYFKKWIVIDNSDADWLAHDLDAYNDDFSFCRLNDKTFKYYEDTYKETEILSDNYQYKEYAEKSSKDFETGTREYLKTVPLGILLEEIKRRVTRDAGEQVLKMISDDCQEICSKISALKVVEPL